MIRIQPSFRSVARKIYSRSFIKSSTVSLSVSSVSGSKDYGSGNYSHKYGSFLNKFGKLLLFPLVLSLIGSKESENCGIIGVVGEDEATGLLLDGLTILKNRGYDSAGLATISSDEDEGILRVTKFASKESTCDSIDLVRLESGKHKGHKVGIGHTRWATHGGKTDNNAHPHTDRHNRIALVHNGTINNSHELRKELMKLGIKFNSETDTEVIAQLVGHYLDEGYDSKSALNFALSRLILYYFLEKLKFLQMLFLINL